MTIGVRGLGGELQVSPGQDVLGDPELAQAVDVVGDGRPGVGEKTNGQGNN